MRRPSPKGKFGTARWSLEPPILLAPLFALLALASLCAATPFVPTRWLGSISLIALCVGSIAAGIRRTAPGERDFESSCSGSADDIDPGRIITFEAPRFRQTLVLSGTCSDGQLRVAATFAGITLTATSVVAFLLAGQVQRAGPITAFGVLLGLLLISAPATIALHIAVQRISVHFTPEHVRVVYRKGLLARSCSEWDASDIGSLRLTGSTRGTLVHLAIEGRSGRLSVPLWGLAFEHAQAMLSRAGCPERWHAPQN